MAETLSMISKISFVAAGICLVVAIILFIRFKIPNVIGDLSGKNARKSIEQMRLLNEKSGTKSYKPSKKNIERGKLTETMHGLDKTEKIKNKQDNERPETGLLKENKIVFSKEQETELLIDEEATELLQDENETVLLGDAVKEISERNKGMPIHILDEVILVHTNEMIR